MLRSAFASDYACQPHPAVVDAVVEACSYPRDSYGADMQTYHALELLRHQFGEHVGVLFVSSGTAANRLALQAMLPRSYSAVISSAQAHLNVHECGSAESLGHKVLAVEANHGKLDPQAIPPLLAQRKDVHYVYPEMISIANATELGTVYSEEDLQVFREVAREHQLLLHVDGARLSNAAAHLNLDRLQLLSFGSGGGGADVVTFGATKNGGMMGDAVIFKDPDIAEAAARLQKQQGQLCARMQCITAQFIALCKNKLWLTNARHANAMASLLAELLQEEFGLSPAYPVQSNAVFVSLPWEVITSLREEVDFHIWDETERIVRWMCSWATVEEDVRNLIELIKKCSP